jgi:hypothetical protein
MKDEDGVHEIYTRDHGVVRVLKNSWQDGGHHIVLTPQGVYQHMSGLPIKDEDEIEAAFGTNEDAKQRCLNWFRNRHAQLDNPPRPITFRGDNTPVFEDGSIPEESDLYNFFSPGPVLSAAIVGLHNYRQRKESGEKAPELRAAPKVEPEPAPPAQEAPKPAPDPLKYSPRARREAKEKAARQAKKAEKAAQAQATG